MTGEDEVRYEIAELLDTFRPIALKNPDTPIRQTAEVLEDLLRRARRAFPQSTTIAEMDSLMGAAGHSALVAKLASLKAATGGGVAVEVPAMNVTREGIFFAGQYFDAFQRIAGILSEAKSSIVVIDGYIDVPVLGLLSTKSPSVAVTILTKPRSASPALRVAVNAFNSQYGGLDVRVTDNFHDRFIVVDDREFYHFGASLKDAGQRGFMFSRMEEPAVIEAFRAVILAERAKAPPLST